MRVVSAAIAPSRAKHSNAGRRGGGLSRHRWSYTNTPSSPAASAVRATPIGMSGSSTKDGSARPSFTGSVRARPRQPHRRVRRTAAGTERDVGAMLRPLEVRAEGSAERLEQQCANLHDAPGDDDAFGVEDVREVDQPECDVVGVRSQQSTSVGIAFAGRGRDLFAGHIGEPAARGGEDRSAPAVFDHLARHPTERVPARDCFPVPAFAARADRAVDVDREVAELRGVAVGAAVHLAVGDDPAADARAECDHRARGGRRRRRHRWPRRVRRRWRRCRRPHAGPSRRQPRHGSARRSRRAGSARS